LTEDYIILTLLQHFQFRLAYPEIYDDKFSTPAFEIEQRRDRKERQERSKNAEAIPAKQAIMARIRRLRLA